MPKKLTLCVLLAALCVLCCSCTGFNPLTENLMRPPKLDAEQKAIEDALMKSVISTNIAFKYPKTGDYRSSFVFHNIDEDEADEVLVFYAAPELSDYARMTLLDQRDGEWYSIADIAGPAHDIEFVSFADLTDNEASDIVVGWSSPDQNENELSVYSYQNGKLENILQKKGSYESHLIGDFDRDGLQDIVLLTNNSPSTLESAWISLVSFNGFNLSTTSSVPLSENIKSFAGVSSGKLSPSGLNVGIFVDELLSGQELVTEVFTVKDGELIPIAACQRADAADALPEPIIALYEGTRRINISTGSGETPAPICDDINSDGVIEIPGVRLFPGYEEIDEAERLYLTEYRRISGTELIRVTAAAVNRSGGYLVEFPVAWIDKVTVINQIENGEWRFVEYGESLDDVSRELARIRVVSQTAYQDKFLENYTKFDPPRGVFSYYGYVPKAVSSQLSITIGELERLFRLL